MHSLRKWMFKPKKTDKSPLAQFYYADEALNAVASELDSFDGRKEPERCTVLINKLRGAQDKVLNIVEKIMVEAIPTRRANRDFRVKFPDDVLQDNLAGQLWFGAECLAAGSSIMNREVESASMRPLAKSLTRHLDQLRSLIREHCLRNTTVYNEELKRALELFDKLFAEFELSYVSAMVPVKTMRDYDILQEVMVLFSETVQRAFKHDLITQDMIDYYDPALMFTIPRLAIVCGLYIYPEGPLNPDMDPVNMSEMFRPFQTLLYKIRELLSTLTPEELTVLEKCLCSNEEPAHLSQQVTHQQQSGSGLKDEEPAHLSQQDQQQSVSGPKDAVSSMALSPCEQESSVALSSEVASSTLMAEEESSSSEEEDSDVDCGDTDSSLTHSSDSIDTSSTDADSHDNAYDHHDDEGSHTNVTSRECERAGQLGVKRRMPHQESKDSGMPSEPDPVHFEAHTVESHRLRHSKSWPDHLHSNNTHGKKSSYSKSPSMYECRDTLFGATVGGPSLELIASSHSGSESEGDLLNRSAQEFTFNIPKNTSLDDHQPPANMCEEEVENSIDSVENSTVRLIPSIAIHGSPSSPPHSEEPSVSRDCSRSHHAADHVAYVTDTLNQIFVTDPEEASQLTYDGARTESQTRDNNTRQTTDDNTNTACYETKQHCENNPICDNSRSATTSDDVTSSEQNGHSQTSTEVDRDVRVTDTGVRDFMSAVTYNRPRGAEGNAAPSRLEVPSTSGTSHRVHYRRMRSCDSKGASSDKDSLSSADSTSMTSEFHDETEISLAIQAAEKAARREARARFKSSGELIHRLFVCVSGVADQLQTNYAADLRHILKCVFECNSSDTPDQEDVSPGSDKNSIDAFVHINAPDSPNASISSTDTSESTQLDTEPPASPSREGALSSSPPAWVPDEEAASCSGCKVAFTFVRRRHHCRNCGKVFCGRCSSNSVPLPQYGQDKPVRVCNRCFMFHVTPFTSVD